MKALENPEGEYGQAVLDLVKALDDNIPEPTRETDKPFLMPIEDIFSIEGRGTVVTGRIERGIIKVNDEVELVGLMKIVLNSFQYTNAELAAEVNRQVEIEVKYEGFLNRDRELVEKMQALEHKILPESIDFQKIESLSKESREKLERIKPGTLGQASRISGVSPADITSLMIYLSKGRRSVSRETNEG